MTRLTKAVAGALLVLGVAGATVVAPSAAADASGMSHHASYDTGWD